MGITQLSTLDQLIDDVLLQLLINLPLCDLLAVRQTCKRLSDLTKLRTIWYRRFSLEVLAKRLPIPGPLLPVDNICSRDLEWRTRRALQLEKCWQSPPRHSLPHAEIQGPDSGSVQKAMLLYGIGDILTVLEYRLQLWTVDDSAGGSQRATRLAEEWISPSSKLVAVQRDIACSTRVVVQSANRIDVLSVDSMSFTCLKTLGCLPSGNLVGFYDRYLLLNTIDFPAARGEVSDTGILLVGWQTEGGNDRNYLLSWNPAYGQFVGFTVFASHLVIAWDRCLTLFPIPGAHIDTTTTTIEPSQRFRFRQRIQSPIVMSACRSRALPGIAYAECNATNEVEALTIIAGPAEQPYGWGPYAPYGGGMSRSLLFVSDKENVGFGLASIPLQMAGECEAISVGPSGRGIWVEDHSIRQCSPKNAITGGGLFTTVECDDYSHPLFPLPTTTKLHPTEDEARIQLDFDDGMGRIAVVVDKEVHVYDML